MVEGVENGHVQLSDLKLFIYTPFNTFSKLEMNNETSSRKGQEEKSRLLYSQ